MSRLSADRERIVHELTQISEAECRLPAEWAGLQRNVNFLLRAFSLHELDHMQHLHKLLASRGRTFSEPQMLLSKAQALRGELLALLLSLSDEEFDSHGSVDGDWSPRQLVEHLSDIDQRYATTIRDVVAAARGSSTTASPA
ncbi:MAG: hypothetical protein NVSMB2_20670 [Chloroflexota bacterium]